MGRKYKYIDKHYLKIINHVSDKVLKFNRTLPDDVIDRLPDDKFFPIVFTIPHEHRAGVQCDPHVRCIIAVPKTDTDDFEKLEMTQLILDMDSSIFDILPETELPDRVEKETVEA
jgi:hypothetical protein